MRIHSLTIDNVRAIEHLKIEQLPQSGVVIIHGDNEQGKSTLMDALNAVLNSKHSSNAKDIRALAPVDRDASPEVSAHLTIGPVEFTITKRWRGGKRAELTVLSPTRSNHTGGDAEEKLEQIKNDYLDTTLLETLFLRQDDLGDAVKAAGIPSLEHALNAGTGDEVIDTSEDDALMAAVEREYQRFYTATGVEKKSFSAVRKDWEKAAEVVESARKKVSDLSAHVDQVERIEAAKSSDEKDLPAAVSDRDQAMAELNAAQQLVLTASGKDEARDRAQSELDAAQKAVADRDELQQELVEAQNAVGEKKKALDTAQRKAEEEKKRIAELTAELDNAKNRRDKTTVAAKEARRTAQLVADSATLVELQRLVEQLDEIDENLSATRATLAGLTVTDDDVAKANQAAQALEVARGIRDLAVSRLELSAASDTDITVDGEPVAIGGNTTRVDLHDGLELTIGQVTATYHAGDGTESDPDADVRRAEQELTDVLDASGCETLDDLRAARDEAAETRATLDALTTRRADLLGGRDAEEVRARAVHLAAQFSDIELPETTLEEARDLVAEAEQKVEAADAAVRSAEAALKPWNAGEADRQLVRAAADHDNAQARALEISEKLDRQQDRVSSEDLAAAVAEAEAKLAQATEARDAAHAALAEADPEGKKICAEAAAARVNSLESRIHNADIELAGLRSYIEQAAGAAEDLEIAVSEEGALRRQLAGLERQANAAARLRDVLRRHRDVARARYAQPFVDELTRLARTVFGPDVHFELSQDLKITERTVAGATVPLGALSGGAKEQLAILTRFAIASLVARENDGTASPVPVVIDDALGSTDPQRLQRIGQLFTQIGGYAQVIVLTCFPQRYDWVQSEKVFAMNQLKQGR